MEASGSSGRRGAAAGGRSRAKRSPGSDLASIKSLGVDILRAIFSLLDHFDLVRCSAVCKSWHSIIYTSSLMLDLYYNKNPFIEVDDVTTLKTSMRSYLEDLAMEQHRSAILSGSADVHQWSGHSIRVNLCRMRRRLILTGVGDKVLRLWCAESYKCLNEYSIPHTKQLVDYDFDENKIVGVTDSTLCIWRRNAQRSILQSREGTFRALCMCYTDPEAVIGCEDGRARIFDMYSGSCSRIFRINSGPVTCLALSHEQLIVGGSTFGTIAITDLSSGERLTLLRSSFSPTGMKSLCFNARSSLLFAGSTSGYAHCWDIRTFRPLWERRVSPNVIYAIHHLVNDTSTLAVGGLDGVLRILNQSTGELLSSLIIDESSTLSNSSSNNADLIQRKKGRALSQDIPVDSVPRCVRPPITCLAVGMKKIVTTHNQKCIQLWRFHK